MGSFAELIIVVSLLILFWGAIRRIANAIEESTELSILAVETVNRTGKASLKTYERDVHISMAKKRKEQEQEITTLGPVPSDDELDSMVEAGLGQDKS